MQVGEREMAQLERAGEGQPSCAATFTYNGKPGNFSAAVQYFDLQGGSARFALSINGQQVDTWSADDHLPSRLTNGDNSTRHIVHNLALKTGDTLQIKATPDAADPAALDYIELLRELETDN